MSAVKLKEAVNEKSSEINMPKRPKKIYINLLVVGLVFAFMLVCNLMTSLLVDDYTYLYSFTDGSPIESVADIFPSIEAHAHKMNGRYMAHFFAQLFLFLPHIIFKFINAAMFCLLICILVRIASREFDYRLFLLGFGLIFIFEQAFGQVNLWLDGSCNYLWSYVVCLLWLLPYLLTLEGQTRTLNGWTKFPLYVRLLVIPLGFIAGGWSENASSATILMAILSLILIIMSGRHVSLELWLSLAAAFGGFSVMALAPAEQKNKVADFSIGTLRENFVNATEMLSEIWVLILIFVLLLTLSFMTETNVLRRVVSIILGIGALASNYIMVFASYYHGRSAAYTAVLFAAACLVLASELVKTEYKRLIICLFTLTLTVFVYFAVIGLDDIYTSNKSVKANEEYLISCRENGIMDVKIPNVSAKTKYSAVKDQKYIDFEYPDTWPNRNMAKYYKLNSILGISE